MNLLDRHAALIRLVESCQIISWDGTRQFAVQATLSDTVRDDFLVLEQDSLVSDIKVEGIRTSSSFSDFLCHDFGKTITATVALPVPNSESAIVRSFEDMLGYDQFMLDMPSNFYEINSGAKELPLKYQHAVKFASLIDKVSDHVEKNGNRRVCFLYSGAKLRIPVYFKAQDISELPGLDDFLENFNVPQHKEKINFFKGALVKVGIGSPSEQQIFTHLLKNFLLIQKTFENDFNVYISDFSIEKVLGEIEEKNMKLADKVAASLSDLQKTMITVPLAIIFAAPRIDNEGLQTWTNCLLLLSVWLFALFTWVFFSSQKRNLRFIVNEIEEQKKKIKETHAQLAAKMLPKFDVLEKRCMDQTCYRRIIGSLMWLTVILLTLVFIYPSISTILSACLLD